MISKKLPARLLHLTLLSVALNPLWSPPEALALDDGKATAVRVTHGPMLGRPATDSMTIWARTNVPGEVKIFYGVSEDRLDQAAPVLTTSIEDDNTGLVTIAGLDSDTRYYYRVEDHQLSGSFRTMPDPKKFRNAETNPEGLFNFSFEFACGNNQAGAGDSVGATMPVYDVLNAEWREKVHFAILNGDWLYEDRREYPASDWLHQVSLSGMEEAPRIVRLAPSIAGVWENYKIYLERGRNLSEWHRHVPSFYTADDHELLNDIYGTAETGYVNRRAVFRDQATQAWFDYLAWANPVEHDGEAWFGKATFAEGSDVLEDPGADFESLDLSTMANLHVHWGTPTDGVKDSDLDAQPGDPNSAVYEIVEVLGPTRLRVNPPAKADGEAVYSIGRRCYGKFSVSNCDFFLLDTRSHRDLHDVDTPAAEGRSMLGKQQFEWLKKGVAESKADFLFLVSSVNFMVPHVGSGGGDDKQTTIKKDDAWTVFLDEREELIELLDGLEQPSFVLTGDLHNSFAIRITDNVYEFASGPHNSINHAPMVDEGGRPANGKFQYGPRECEIRWSSYAMEDIPRAERRFPHFCVVRVNNVFNNPVKRDGNRWFAFPHPQVVFQFYDALTGEFRYSETIVKGLP